MTMKVAVPVPWLTEVADYFMDNCHDEIAQRIEFQIREGILRKVAAGTFTAGLQGLAFSPADHDAAAAMARALGYASWAYTTTSEIGAALTMMPMHTSQRPGVIIKIDGFGLLFVQDAADLGLR